MAVVGILLLDNYRKGDVTEWLEFFLKGVTQICGEAIDTSNKIIELSKDKKRSLSLSNSARKRADNFQEDVFENKILDLIYG